MNNLYWGNNISQAGGSFLLSKARINIQEGYEYSLYGMTDIQISGFEDGSSWIFTGTTPYFSTTKFIEGVQSAQINRFGSFDGRADRYVAQNYYNGTSYNYSFKFWAGVSNQSTLSGLYLVFTTGNSSSGLSANDIASYKIEGSSLSYAGQYYTARMSDFYKGSSFGGFDNIKVSSFRPVSTALGISPAPITFVDDLRILGDTQILGSTTEYINQGDFEVSDFSFGGFNNNRLNLELESPLERIKSTSLLNKIDYNSGKILVETFDNTNKIYDFNISESSWGITSSTLISTNPSSTNSIIYSTDSFADFMMVVKFNFNTDTSDNRFNILFRSDGKPYDDSDSNSYSLRVFPDLNNYNITKRLDGTSSIISAAVSHTFTASTNYWFKIICKGDLIEVFSSDDGLSYIRDHSITDSSLRSGTFGIRVSSGAATHSFDLVEIAEFANVYSSDDLIRKGFALASNFDVLTSNQIQDFTDFTGSSGSNWGASSTYLRLLNTTGGSLFHTYHTMGSSYSDFIFECEARGVSGTFLGLFSGVSSSYYVNYFQLGTGSSVNRIENVRSTSRTQIDPASSHINLHHSIWYKLKIQKEATLIRWFVNDTLSGYINGSSSSTSTGENQTIGMAVWKNGASGKYTEFRNPKLKVLNSKIQESSIDQNQKVNSFINRLLPEGYDSVHSGNNIEVIRLGTSRGNIVISNDSLLTEISSDYSNNQGYKQYEFIGEDSYYRIGTTVSRVVKQVDGAQYFWEADLTLENNEDTVERTNSTKQENIRKVETLTLSGLPRVTLENYDFVDLSDNTIGINQRYIVLNNLKSYQAATGEFNQRITLGLYE